ncbi:MAG: hypothetical protein HY800_04355, partial [Ignavibacteriales bacterium]|nr:hypothetical protein [Ignavibacteriales bacterium]
MRISNIISFSFVTILFASHIFLFGCGGSTAVEKEGELPPPPPSATEVLQKEMSDLKSANEELKKQIMQCEQDKR